jgi:hypothetical protein
MWPSAFSSRVLDACRLQDVLFLGNLDRQMRGDRIGELGRLLDLGDRGDDVGRNLLVQLDVVLELGDHRARQRGELDRVLFRLVDRDRIGLEVAVAIRIALDFHARNAFDQHLDGVVGQFQQLQNVGDGAVGVDRLGRRIVVAGILLGRQQDLTVVLHHVLERTDRLLASDEKRHDHVRENNNVAQRQDGVEPVSAARCRFLIGFSHSFVPFVPFRLWSGLFRAQWPRKKCSPCKWRRANRISTV